MSPDPKQRLIERIQGTAQAVWVFCGDSITEGIVHTHGRRNYVQLVESRVRFLEEKGWTMHLFVNSAISGNTTAQVAETLEHRVLRFKPDVFSLMIGMNDSCNLRPEQFADNLRNIVGRVRASCKSEVLLQTCNAIHPDLHPERGAFPQFMDIVRSVAAELETALIDHHAVWERTRIENRAVFDTWTADRGHPNALGHWVMADRILRELEIGPLGKAHAP